MTPEELKHIRTLMLFSTAEAAEWVGEIPETDWIALEEDASLTIPDETINRLTQICYWHHRTLVDTGKHLEKESPDNVATMVWYDTLEDWTITGHPFVFLFRPYQSVCAILEDHFKDLVVLQKFDKENYLSWLKFNNLPETEITNERQIIRWATEITNALEQTPNTNAQ